MASIITSNLQHPTQFMLDLACPYQDKPRQMPSYNEKEADYDLAFCKAWKEIDLAKDSPITNAKTFLALLDKVQKAAISHLPEKEIKMKGHQEILKPIQGRGTYNFYGISKNLNSDKEGIKDIIRKIWIDKQPFTLEIQTENYSKIFLTPDQLSIVANGEKTIFISYSETKVTEDLEKISVYLLSFYNKGLCGNKTDRMRIFHTASLEYKESQAIKIINIFFKAIQTSTTPQEKTEAIANVIRDLMQLHLYFEGNARTLYMFANLLLYQNGLPLFYPRNMCLFDANSINKILQEITDGQTRFINMFGSLDQLTNGLKEYEMAIANLKKFQTMFNKNKVLKELVAVRKFDLLLRQLATDPKYINVFEVLLNQAEALGLNLFAKGETSGNALDIALEFKNDKAIELLKEKGLKPTLIKST